MKTCNDVNILNLLEQIREVNHLIEIHSFSNDNFMTMQYKARKNDYIKELIYELMRLNINTDEIFQLVRNLINKLETNSNNTETGFSYNDLHFSLKELEEVTC